jgi:inward rectifier potassium channel
MPYGQDKSSIIEPSPLFKVQPYIMRTEKNDKVVDIQMGNVKLRKQSALRTEWRDFYHFVLQLSWPRFYTLIVGFFIAVNLMFGCAYALVDGSVANAHKGSFFDLFFFSVETLATVGYGVMSPGNLYGHIVASLEILLGMMSLAVVTGLIFVRFSKPTARILFSDKIVVRDFDGGRVLMVRVANERHNRILEASATMSMVREETSGGERLMRIHDLPLVRSQTPAFALTWTLIHRIDAGSPLYGWDEARLAASKPFFSLSITGHDETIADSVHALQTYGADALRFDHRFVDIIAFEADGSRTIDFTRFHEVVSERAA